MQELNAKVTALESENNSLKQVIEQISAERNALDQTVTEILRANISLKAGCAMLENRINKMNIEIVKKDEQIKALQPVVTKEPISELETEN
jgi:DNA-binding FrmR family transcriptional regulator